MSVRARWHTERGVPEDPLEETPVVRSEEDLTTDEGRLEHRLRQLIERESQLYNAGTTCALRDHPESSCSACPIAHHRDYLHPLQPLCETGREMDRVLTEIALQHVEEKHGPQ